MSRRRGYEHRRGKGGLPFVQLHNWLLDSPAWRALSPNARCVYLAVKRHYDGKNNGSISFSARQAGDAIGTSHHTGNRALAELIEAGFIEITEDSNFDRKVKIARSYLLTEAADDRPGQSRVASKTFMRMPAKENHSLTGERHSRAHETVPGNKAPKSTEQSHQRDCEPRKARGHSRTHETHIDIYHIPSAAQPREQASPSKASGERTGLAEGFTSTDAAVAAHVATIKPSAALLNSKLLRSEQAKSGRSRRRGVA
jgi:hypothetical protein